MTLNKKLWTFSSRFWGFRSNDTAVHDAALLAERFLELYHMIFWYMIFLPRDLISSSPAALFIRMMHAWMLSCWVSTRGILSYSQAAAMIVWRCSLWLLCQEEGYKNLWCVIIIIIISCRIIEIVLSPPPPPPPCLLPNQQYLMLLVTKLLLCRDSSYNTFMSVQVVIAGREIQFLQQSICNLITSKAFLCWWWRKKLFVSIPY